MDLGQLSAFLRKTQPEVAEALDLGQDGPMQVVAGPVGKERVHFKAPDAARLEQEMASFLDWFNSGETVDPVLKAGLAHLWFVTIHPFDDGNGRIARALADL
jgi:Fic family protein